MDYLKRHGIGMLFGALFTLLVGYFLVRGHTTEVEVPEAVPDKVVVDSGGISPGLWACDSAPFCTGEELAEVATWWAKHGRKVKELGAGECPDLCEFGERKVPCKKGWTSISLADAWFSDDHAGETIIPQGDGDIVILLPALVEAADPTEGVGAPLLPADVEKLVCAHEVGHSFNLGHEYTTVGSGLVMRKKGHVLHPVVTELGWGDEGL